MTRSHPHSTGGTTKNRWAHVGISIAFALIVAGGAKVAFDLSSTMMTHLALVGAWMMLALGLAYAGVRIRPSLGGALLTGFGIGALLVIFFGGMQMIA
ncbi:hypothetical protein Amsp01_104980 [Amycolatopsis sp. NBRC 101858]|uniref:hypothetical protein n=1 Tax=Amycolatopsis sp. NBRC 101858 TaxID=3032200 RepID=UPI0024A2039F|nr:hypothetical protein [Amycolatopsis sp. NBRC 101858]GLY44475.1 hypothetical protein Amsp01_104980 [Amycolatopsis sp. NBRC 101858]